LHVVLEDFRTTKDSVTLSFGTDAGLFIIFDTGGLGQLDGDYRLVTTRASAASADITIAVTQANEAPLTVFADGTPLATCQPAGSETGTCVLGSG
jgi:hypothetical protein